MNITTLARRSVSALRHAHLIQDEFVYVVSGRPTLCTDAGAEQMEPGYCAGFKAGTGDGHRLENRTDSPVVYLEMGDRSAGNKVIYPRDDLLVKFARGRRSFLHKNSEPY